MGQVWHIFKKDARYLWREIAFMDAMVVIFAWTNPWWIAALLIAAASYLIGRLIHAEALPGDRQFWITRPYHWLSLLSAKLLFVFVFVNLPIMLAQISILFRCRFPLWSSVPGLLWSQLLMILLGSLPAAVLGAITAGMVSYIFAILILAGIVFTIDTPILLSVEIQHPLWPGGIEWIRDTAAVLALAAVLIFVLYTQYRTRRTFLGRAAAMGGAALAAISYLYLPWPPAWALQSLLSKQAVESSALRISLDPKTIRFVPQKAQTWENVEIFLPMTITGIPDALDLRTDAVALTLEAPDGRTWKSSFGGAKRRSSGSGVALVDVTTSMDTSFFNRERDQSITLRGSIFLTLYGNYRTKTIPLAHKPVNALEGLQCYLGVFDQFYCRAPFRWPARLVYAKFGAVSSPLTESVSYSPFPSGLHLDPIETRWAPSLPHSAREVTIEMEEPLAHVRREFQLQGVHLLASTVAE